MAENSIQDNITVIRKGIYGRDVRKAIADALERCYASDNEKVKDYVAEWLDEHPESITTIDDGEVVLSMLNPNAINCVNVAGKTADNAPLTSENIGDAILAALKDSSFIYIPAGDYRFNVAIDGNDGYKKCHILLDSNATIGTDNGIPCIKASNCSFSMIGGQIVSGNRVAKIAINSSTSNTILNDDEHDFYGLNQRTNLGYDAYEKLLIFMRDHNIPYFEWGSSGEEAALEEAGITETQNPLLRKEYDILKETYNSHHAIIDLQNCYDCLFCGITSPYSNSLYVFRVDSSARVVFERCNFDYILESAILFYNHCENVTVRNCVFKNSRYFIRKTKYYYTTGTAQPSTSQMANELAELASDENENYIVRGDEILLQEQNPSTGKEGHWFSFVRERRHYCYFVYTGSANSITNPIRPTGGLIYENNYGDNSEDCGLDTHGARDVIIRNNTVNNTVCAITAYNDDQRCMRPADWCMENTIIENNACKSNKMNNPKTKWPHNFIFLGAANGYSIHDPGPSGDSGYPQYAQNPARYNSFRNCIVRNNTFISKNDWPSLLTLDSMSSNVIIENNYFDATNTSTKNSKGESVDRRAIGLGRTIKTIIRNNTYGTNANVNAELNAYYSLQDDCVNTRVTSYLHYVDTPAIYNTNIGTVNKAGDIIRLSPIISSINSVAVSDKFVSPVSGYAIRLNRSYRGFGIYPNSSELRESKPYIIQIKQENIVNSETGVVEKYVVKGVRKWDQSYDNTKDVNVSWSPNRTNSEIVSRWENFNQSHGFINPTEAEKPDWSQKTAAQINEWWTEWNTAKGNKLPVEVPPALDIIPGLSVIIYKVSSFNKNDIYNGGRSSDPLYYTTNGSTVTNFSYISGYIKEVIGRDSFYFQDSDAIKKYVSQEYYDENNVFYMYIRNGNSVYDPSAVGSVDISIKYENDPGGGGYENEDTPLTN